MFTHCDSLRVALSVTLRLTHIFSPRSPCSSCFSCRPLLLTSFPLPLAAFWCSNSSRDALPYSLHLQGFNSRRYSARSNYPFSSHAPRGICHSLCDTRFTLGGRCIPPNLVKYTFSVVGLLQSELCVSVTLSCPPPHVVCHQPVQKSCLPFMSSNILRTAHIYCQFHSSRRKVSLKLQLQTVSAFNQAAPEAQRKGLCSRGEMKL